MLTLSIALSLLFSSSTDIDDKFLKKTFVYETINDFKIHADVYRSERKKKQPILVWIHGGALIVGTRNDVPNELRGFCKVEGCILISLDYRLAPEIKLPQIAEDIEDALCWIHDKGAELFQADPTRIVVAGGSAGAYLSLITGTMDSVPKPSALVSCWGYGDISGSWYLEPSDHYNTHFPQLSASEVNKTVGNGILTNTVWKSPLRKGRTSYYVYVRQNGLWTREVAGFDPLSEPRLIINYSPIFKVSSKFPPTFLIHGIDDRDVPYKQSVAMSKALSKHQVPNQLVLVQQAGHRLIGGDRDEITEAKNRALAFIKFYLQ